MPVVSSCRSRVYKQKALCTFTRVRILKRRSSFPCESSHNRTRSSYNLFESQISLVMSGEKKKDRIMNRGRCATTGTYIYISGTHHYNNTFARITQNEKESYIYALFVPNSWTIPLDAYLNSSGEGKNNVNIPKQTDILYSALIRFLNVYFSSLFFLQGMYYHYFKTIAESNSFIEGLAKVSRDNLSEYNNVIDAGKKYNLLPEVSLASL